MIMPKVKWGKRARERELIASREKKNGKCSRTRAKSFASSPFIVAFRLPNHAWTCMGLLWTILARSFSFSPLLPQGLRNFLFSLGGEFFAQEGKAARLAGPGPWAGPAQSSDEIKCWRKKKKSAGKTPRPTFSSSNLRANGAAAKRIFLRLREEIRVTKKG